MSATDTLRTARTLTEAGVPDRQADATARAIEDAAGDVLDRVATREDLARLETRLYRVLLIQTGVIVGAVVALLRLIP
ncbi:MAG: hypothetical protein F4086_16120 [Gemmatimonadetes bacterium]|nr:hypothetical protein [Gemmatimonadota bacterium]